MMTAVDLKAELDDIDKALINHLQDGFPLTVRPFASVAEQLLEQSAGELNLTEAEIMARVQALLDNGILSRFGPMYQAERLGGGLTLAAMKIAPEDFQRVTEQVNSFSRLRTTISVNTN